MDENEGQKEFFTALTTEHFTLQTAASATVSEAAGRSTLYVMSLSSSLVAMGFTSGAPDIFYPFAGAILPALFVLGLFTIARLVDTGIEYQRCLTAMGRIRNYYSALTPEAASFFAPAERRTQIQPATLRFGGLLAFFTTAASMIAFINSLVAGAGVALLVSYLLGREQMVVALGVGVVTALVVMALFVRYQTWIYGMSGMRRGGEKKG